MTRPLALPLCCLALSTTPLLAHPLFAQAAVPIHLEPRHRPVYEGPGFRVLDVQIPVGDTTRYHIHDAAILYTLVSASPTDFQLVGAAWNGTKPTDDPGWSPGDTRMDTGYVAQPVTHRVTNVGRGLFRLIAVVSTRRGAKGDSPSLTLEAPGTPERRSTWFRQARLQLPVQTVTAWHNSSAPLVIVQPFDGDIEVESARGAQRLEASGSFATIAAGQRYRLRNTGKLPATVVIVQVR